MMDDTRSVFYYIIIFSGILVLLHIHYRKNTIPVVPYTKAVSHPYYKYPTILPISNWSQLNESNPEEFLRYKPLSFRLLNSPASPISDQIQCSRILANDQDYIKNWTRGPKPDNQFRIENNLMPKNRVNYTDEDDLQTDCGSIKKRNYFMPFPNSIEEAEFPIAFARHVNKDYLFLEMELAAEYAPQNFYCYTLDTKAPELFKQRIRNLATCFSNVFVAEREINTNRFGAKASYALMECFTVLSNHSWNYVFSLQNHDVILRPNYELVQILKLFGGANDIAVQITNTNLGRINQELDWSFAGLNLFIDASKNWPNNGTSISPKMDFATGLFQASVSRAMVDFMLNELNLSKYMAQLEGRFAIDEFFLTTLQTTDALNAPGGFTHVCLDRGIEVKHVSRYNIWSFEHELKNCYSGDFRHSLCIFGLEDLHRLTQLPHLFVNKMMPEYDFGAMVCWYEHMFNRIHLEPPNSRNLNPDYYLSMPHVRFHNEKKRNGSVNIRYFDCNFKYKDCWIENKCL